MNLKRTMLPLVCTGLCLSACNTIPEIIWKEGERQPNEKAAHTIEVRGMGSLKEKDWTIWCSQMPIKVKN